MENADLCPHCGQQHSSNTSHCPIKGLPIFKNPNTKSKKHTNKKMDKKTWLIGGIGAGIVLVVLCLLLFLWILPGTLNKPPIVVQPPYTVPTLTLPPLESRIGLNTPVVVETTPGTTPGTTPQTTATTEPWEACENAPLPSRLQVGSTAQVALDPPLPNRVRQDPNTSAAINGYVDPGETVTIIEGPACDQNWVWWKVEAQSGNLIGWTAEGDQQSYWLVPVP